MKHHLGANTYAARGVILAVAIVLASGCARLPRPAPKNAQHGISASGNTAVATPNKVNINTAGAEELEKLPGVGQVLAARIVEHRQRFGPFRRAEHLIVVRGLSDRRFRLISPMVTAE